MILRSLVLFLTAILPCLAAEPKKSWRIMPVGDSITEGGSTFSVYRLPLWEKLTAAGYVFEYVGTKSSPSRVGPLAHEGYGGKNAEFLATVVPASFARTPADIVLIQAGHNHTVEEKPVPGILAATESMINGIRKTNPKVIILVAQPVLSGKLPKYAYLPDLGKEIPVLAKRLSTADSPVIAVDQAAGFDFRTDAIDDKVHPNAAGAEKMARCWFEALTKVMGKAQPGPEPKIIPFKKTPQGELSLHLFEPDASGSKAGRAAIVFFFGGGWTTGTPLQFYPECAHFAAGGLVAISADYRIQSVHRTTPFESVADGKSAIRWVRQHAAELGVDPQRIIAAGASAGGQVAAATGTLAGLDEATEDRSISSRPNAMILWYPVIDNGPDGYGDAAMKASFQEISPLHNITASTPPALVFLGTADKLVPVATGRAFEEKMKAAGVRCELMLFEGAGHPIYEYRKGPSTLRDQILSAADKFIASLRS